MTNFERIKQMSIEDMALNYFDYFDCNFCTEHRLISDNLFMRNDKCDGNCRLHLKEWLESDVTENAET